LRPVGRLRGAGPRAAGPFATRAVAIPPHVAHLVLVAIGDVFPSHWAPNALGKQRFGHRRQRDERAPGSEDAVGSEHMLVLALLFDAESGHLSVRRAHARCPALYPHNPGLDIKSILYLQSVGDRIPFVPLPGFGPEKQVVPVSPR